MATLERARLLIAHRRLDDAAKELRGILASDPDQAEPHALLAICLCEDKPKWDEAFDEAKAAIRLEPDNPYFHFVLSEVLFSRDRYAEARIAINEALRLDPDDADYWGRLASIEAAESKWTPALEATKTGLQIDPDNVACRNLRTIALERLGRTEEARQSARDTLRDSPSDSMSHASAGWASLNSGAYQEAQVHFREALRLNPDNQFARDGMISALNSRYFVFRCVYQFQSWMSRFSGRAQWGLIIGIWFATKFLNRTADSGASLAWIARPAYYLLIGAILLTWIATPLFNLFLRQNAFAKYLLSPKQIWASNLVGMCVAGALIGAMWGAFRSNLWLGLAIALYWFGCTILVTIAFNQRTITRTWMVSALVGILALIPVYGVARAWASSSLNGLEDLFYVYLVGLFFAQIGHNLLAGIRPRY